MIGTMTIRLGTVHVIIMELRRLSAMRHQSLDGCHRLLFMAHTLQQLLHLRLTVFAPVVAHVKRAGMYENSPRYLGKSRLERVADCEY